MEWTKEAEKAVSRVPFFVRKRVKKRVEEEAALVDSKIVTMEHVDRSQKKFLGNMENEVQGYQVETCFGQSGCPNRVTDEDDLAERLEETMKARDWKAYMKTRVDGPLKMHHEFRVSASTCPNSCSRPQIVDLGLIGACLPELTDEDCTQCGACVDACAEDAITLEDGAENPTIDFDKCLACAKCIQACPTGTLAEGEKGYRALVGGKLGRHPQLGMDLGRIFTTDQVIEVLNACLDFYQENNVEGERFGAVVSRAGLEKIAGLIESRIS